MNEKCPRCLIPVGPMPEDASASEMLCNTCAEKEEYTPQEIEIIKRAWAAQNGCNASGILFSFARDMQKLCDLQHEKVIPGGTDYRNKHLAVQLYVSKLQSLCGDIPLHLPAFLFE